MNNKHQLVLIDDDVSDKLEQQIWDKDQLENRTAPRQDGRLYNPILHMDMSQFKKHNSLVPLKNKDVSNIELRQMDNDDAQKTDLLIVKLKNKDPPESKLTEKKVEVLPSKMTSKSLDTKEPSESPFLKKVENFLESNWVMFSMTSFTVFALFASDIQSAWLPSSVDFTFDVIQTLLFLLFTLEIVLASFAKKDYLWSFFFWLDVVATLTLLQDISFIFDNMLTGLNPPTIYSNITTIEEGNGNTNSHKNSPQATSSIQKVSSASRATRVLRIIRIIRLIRIVKLYKSAVQAREKIEKKKKEKKEKEKKEKERMMNLIKESEMEVSKDEGLYRSPIVQSEANEENAEVISPERKKLVDSKNPTTVDRLKEKTLGRRSLKRNCN